MTVVRASNDSLESRVTDASVNREPFHNASQRACRAGVNRESNCFQVNILAHM